MAKHQIKVLIFSFVLAASSLVLLPVAMGQVSGTVINNSEWTNNAISAISVPPHWPVAPDGGIRGSGKVIVELLDLSNPDDPQRTHNDYLVPPGSVTNLPVSLPVIMDTNGVYSLGDSALAAGEYRVRAWIDGNENGEWDEGEPMGTKDLTLSGSVYTGTSPSDDNIIRIEDDADGDDTVGDGMADWWEAHWFGDLAQTTAMDYDNDGLSNGQEYELINSTTGVMINVAGGAWISFTNVFVEPDNWDTDYDGMDDAWELFYAPDLNPVVSDWLGDPDLDGISNFEEYTGPDGIGWRRDANGDNIAEYTTSRDALNPMSVDSDQDGVSDGDEFGLYLSHPVHSMSGTNFYPRSLEMSLNGNTNGVAISDTSTNMYAFGSGGGTVEFWVRPGADGDGVVYGFTNVVVGMPHFRISLEDYRPKLEILSGSIVRAFVGGVGANGSVQQLDPDVWTHVACVISPQNNSLVLYIDGVLLIAQEYFLKPYFMLGNPTVCQDFTDGYLDELRVWNYPRSAADIEYWASRYYPAPGYIQDQATRASGSTASMYEYAKPLLGYFRFDDGGLKVENFAFINYGLYPNANPYYLGTNVAAAVTKDQAAPMAGSDDADGDGLPEWWTELHGIEKYLEFYSSAYGPIREGCPDDDALLQGFEYFRSFPAYGSVGTSEEWQEEGGVIFLSPKTAPDFYDADRSSYMRYVYLFSQPQECPLKIYTPGMLSTIITVNGTQVTTVGDEANTAQAYDIAQYMQTGRNQIHVECQSEITYADYDEATGVIEGVPYTVSDYQAYNTSMSDAPEDCDSAPYSFQVATGKFDAELLCNGVPMVVRGDESRADPRAVWHCQIWTELYELLNAVPRPDQEGRAVPENVDYGVPLNAERDSNPQYPDFADDQLDAVYEYICGTNPRDRDSNNNGVGDGDEDFDLDGLVNREEQRFGSDPWLPDSDDDGLIDGSDIGSAGHPAQSLSPQNNLSICLGGAQTDFLTFPKEQRFALDKWTLEAWFKPDSDEADGGIIIQRSVSSNAVNYEIGLTTANIPYVRYVSIGGAEVRADSAVVVPADGATWTHVAASYYDRDLVLYVNGSNVASTTGVAFPALYAGGPIVQHVGRGFKGCIDEARIWDEERSAAEILEKRDVVLTGLEETLVAYYRFDDNTSYTNLPPIVGTSANNGTNGSSSSVVAWTWGQVEDNVLQYASDWQNQWEHAASFNGDVTFSTNHIIMGPAQLQVYIETDDAVDAGAMWTYNGGATWNDSGALVTSLDPGDHIINFDDVEGWLAPDALDVTLIRGESTVVTGVYMQTASLTVIIDNTTEVKSYATWSSDGGINNYGSGIRIDSLRPGSPGFDIIFADISGDVLGWDRPASIHVDLLEAEERTVTASYTPVSGSLQITFTPDEAPSGARWCVSGNSNWFGSGEIVTNLAYGEHEVEYNSIEWWEAPDDETLTIEDSTLHTFERLWTKLSEPSSITTILTPNIAVSAGAQWLLDGDTYNSGEAVVVDAGLHTVSFTDLSGYLTPLDLSVNASNSSVTVTGAYYQVQILGVSGGPGVAGALLNPRGVTLDGDRLYVCDSDHHQVQVYDIATEIWQILGGEGNQAGQFRQPFGLATDDSGNLWVADTGNHRIQRRDAATGVWLTWGAQGTGLGQFNAPYDVVADAQGNAYVADYQNSRVQKRNSTGGWSVLIAAGSEDGKVRYPGALHLGTDGMLYVSDYDPAIGSVRIQKFTRAGAYLETVGSSLSTDGGLGRPFGTTLMADGSLLVTDTDDDVIWQRSATEDWSYLVSQGALLNPHDITSDLMGNVYIADTGNARILRMPARDSDDDGIPDIFETPLPAGVDVQTVLLLSSALESYGSAGGTGSFNAIGNVSWTATSDAAWVVVDNDGVSMAVSGPVNYTVSANSLLVSRCATITVVGDGVTRTYVVSQPVATLGNDYVGDRRSELTVFDQETGRWFIRGVDGSILGFSLNWGWHGVRAVAGDYDGDGVDDMAVFDPASGVWYIRSPGGNIILANAGWGWAGVESLSGDYDGDGKDDLAVFDQNTGRWFIRSVSGSTLAWSMYWGWPGVQPMGADYDGDGTSDLGIFDRDSGRWFIRTLSGDILAWHLNWGWAGCRAVPGDYNGDGLADLAVFDELSGSWYIRSLGGTQLAWNLQWGWPGVTPVSGDFDGDGTSDLAVFDTETGRWFARSLTNGILVWNSYWGWRGVQAVGR